MIKVDEHTCIGCGACVAIAPDNFDFNESGLSQAISEEITDASREAAASCPVNAITIKESNKASNENEFPSNNMETPQDKAA